MSNTAEQVLDYQGLLEQYQALLAENQKLQSENTALQEPNHRLHHALESLHEHQEELRSQNDTLKAIQSDLQLSRNSYQQLFDFAPIAYLSINEKGIIEAANFAAGHLFQTQTRNLCKQSIYKYLSKQDQVQFKHFLRHVFNNESIQDSIELHLLHEINNHAVFVSIHARLFTSNKKEEHSLCFISVSDISAQKRAEMALRESELRFRSLVENINAIAWSYNIADKRFTYVSPHAENLLGYPLGKWQDLDFFRQTVHPDDKLILQELLQTAINNNQQQAFEYRMRTTKDTYIWLKNIVTTKISQSSVLYLSGFMVDINQLKNTEIQLRQAKDDAETANRAKSAFLANMSHELRTPLNAILGYTQLLDRNLHVDTDVRQQIKIIERSGEHLLQLINDILDLSKIEAERLEVVNTDVYLPGLMQDIAQLFQLRAEQKQIAFKINPLPFQENFQKNKIPVIVSTDEKRLRQVLLNLLNNAFKFTEYGEISLGIAWHEGLLFFEIHDTGCGINTEDLTAIFEPFQQVGTQKYIEGSGLGLPISRRLVDMMGGHLDVESHIGNGSIFKFFIQAPLQKWKLAGQEIQETQKKRIAIHYHGKQRRMMIVDDVVNNRTVLADWLKQLGFLVHTFKDVNTALSHAAQHKPDIVLIDLVMPKIDGFMGITQLRQLPDGHTCCIIAISATVTEEQKAHALAVGANGFIEKPFKHQTFLDTLKTLAGIEWEYADSDESTEASHHEESQQLVFPEAAIVTQLIELARLGHIQGVMELAQEELKKQPTLSSFYTKIIDFADNFLIKELRDFLQSKKHV